MPEGAEKRSLLLAGVAVLPVGAGVAVFPVGAGVDVIPVGADVTERPVAAAPAVPLTAPGFTAGVAVRPPPAGTLPEDLPNSALLLEKEYALRGEIPAFAYLSPILG